MSKLFNDNDDVLEILINADELSIETMKEYCTEHNLTIIEF